LTELERDTAFIKLDFLSNFFELAEIILKLKSNLAPIKFKVLLNF
jgi:hypothetical protein